MITLKKYDILVPWLISSILISPSYPHDFIFQDLKFISVSKITFLMYFTFELHYFQFAFHMWIHTFRTRLGPNKRTDCFSNFPSHHLGGKEDFVLDPLDLFVPLLRSQLWVFGEWRDTKLVSNLHFNFNFIHLWLIEERRVETHFKFSAHKKY